MNSPNSKRVDELKAERKCHQQKVTDCNNWLHEHSEHADRTIVHRDKSWHEYQVNLINKKIQNLIENKPENGYASDYENNVKPEIINKTIS